MATLAVACVGASTEPRESALPHSQRGANGAPAERSNASRDGTQAERQSAPLTSTQAERQSAPLTSAVAMVDGVPIGSAAAFRLLLLSVPDEANNAVRQLVLDQLAAAESGAAGVRVPDAVLERELARLLTDQERKIAEASRGSRDLTAHVKATWGITREAYDALARSTLERSLRLERVVLHELCRHPRVQLRLLRVKERALAEEVARKLDQGADFAALARQHSEDGSAREGGVYPPLPSDLPSPLFDHTENLADGERTAVHEVATADGPRWRIVQLLARLPADDRPLAERNAAIEALLDGRALAPPELEAWMRVMEERHQIRFLGVEGELDERR
ncbi:MAG: hypothetical protein EXS13_10560 [Planctomycetes bacterium]|nr:hypothetical protein [Planctomycetota bacterium]